MANEEKPCPEYEAGRRIAIGLIDTNKGAGELFFREVRDYLKDHTELELSIKNGAKAKEIFVGVYTIGSGMDEVRCETLPLSQAFRNLLNPSHYDEEDREEVAKYLIDMAAQIRAV